MKQLDKDAEDEEYLTFDDKVEIEVMKHQELIKQRFGDLAKESRSTRKQLYRALLLRYHPDKISEPVTEFKEKVCRELLWWV